MYIEFLKEFTLRALGADEAASYGTVRPVKALEEGEEPAEARADIQKQVF